MDEGSRGSGDWTFGGETSGYFDRASISILNDFGWNLPLDDHRIITGSHDHISSGLATPPLDLTAADQEEHPSPSAPTSARFTDAVSSSSSEDVAEAPPSDQQEEKPPESSTSAAAAAAAAA